MGKTGDLKLAEKLAEGAKIMMREYIAEMRRQGKIKGKLYVRIREGRRKVEFPYRES
jgi:hypothetical protein